MDDQEIRLQASKDFKKFVAIYLSGAFNDAVKGFHHTIMDSCADVEHKNVLITGFRGSGKSTIANTAFVLWAALTKQYHFIVVIGDTGEQAKASFRNIRIELEENEMIKADFGDMHMRAGGPEGSWQTQKLILANGVQIFGRSRGQKVRGLRHGRYRPDCIVIDDPEESDWVRTKENRDKTERWMRQEVFPSMATGRTKVIVIGNYLHNDALLARLKNSGLFTKPIDIPLFDDNGVNAWPEKFTPEVVEQKKNEAGFIGWNREYLLKVVPDEGQIILPEDIQYYDAIPEDATGGMNVHGVDLAISKDQAADYTAVVNGIVYRYGQGKKAHLCITPGTINRHLDFKEMTDALYEMNKSGGTHLFFVEEVGYQKAAIETLQRYQVPVTAVRPILDKAARLRVASQFIKDGTVRFPKTGCEELLTQLYGFGAESHDDMCFNSETKILTRRGEVPIKNVKVGDEVMTRQGYKRVLASGITGFKPTIERFGLRGTANHPVITPTGTIALQDLESSSMIYILEKGSHIIKATQAGRARYVKNRSYITQAKKAGGSARVNALPPFSLQISERDSPVRSGHPKCEKDLPKQRLERNIGIGVEAISAIPRFIAGLNGIAANQNNVSIADAPTGNANGRIKAESICAILTTSSVYADSAIENTMRYFSDHARNVESHLTPFKQKRSSARSNTASDGTIGIAEPVYNLTIEGAHEFFANGILVHNCDALVYLILGTVAEGLDLQKVVWLEL